MNNPGHARHLMRLGIHAEQGYFVHCQSYYDMAVINANVADYTAKATASLLFGRLIDKEYVIDPCTHAFAQLPQYVMTKAKPGEPPRVKRSIAGLAVQYGDLVQRKVGQVPLRPGDLDDGGLRSDFVRRVIAFQVDRFSGAISEDAKYFEGDAAIRAPAFLIAPYFYMGLGSHRDWLRVNLALLDEAKRHCGDSHLFGEIVIDPGLLDNENVRKTIAEAYAASESCDGYLIWISNFPEYDATVPSLVGLRRLVERLGKDRPVFSLYGGYFSLLLYSFGLGGVCHGPGYGEERNVVPVGGGIPAPKFYLTPIHKRLASEDVELMVAGGAWGDIGEFHNEVCAGPTCTEVLAGSLDNFHKFVEVDTRETSQHRLISVMTPETRDNTVLHYLEAKAQEFADVSTRDPGDLLARLDNARHRYSEWLPESELRHLITWAEALRSP